tara:strand:- start:651 stop:1379 length:729 start_codon:yes stop_codon:yes gene_type:complete
VSDKAPGHIAIIMDGNGRWAKQNQLGYRWQGHRYGVNAIRDVVKGAIDKDVHTLTLFAFSKENQQRHPNEINALIALFKDACNRETNELIAQGVQLTFFGDIKALSPELCEIASTAEKATCSGQRLRLNVALNYSGRWQITEAIKATIKSVTSNQINESDISEAYISSQLNQVLGSEPDLLIRTGGEKRISNFLLWQLAYAELYFDDKLWPDYNRFDLFNAIKDYGNRQRRFGLEKANEELL